MHGRLHVPKVGHVHGDLRALIHMQGRAGDRTVVCQHPQLGVLDALVDRTDAQVEAIPVAEPDDPRTGHLRQPRGIGGETRLEKSWLFLTGWRSKSLGQWPCATDR